MVVDKMGLVMHDNITRALEAFGRMSFTKKQRADRYIEKTMCLIFQTGYPIKTGEMIKF